jgi:hypothetical protein
MLGKICDCGHEHVLVELELSYPCSQNLGETPKCRCQRFRRMDADKLLCNELLLLAETCYCSPECNHCKVVTRAASRIAQLILNGTLTADKQ